MVCTSLIGHAKRVTPQIAEQAIITPETDPGMPGFTVGNGKMTVKLNLGQIYAGGVLLLPHMHYPLRSLLILRLTWWT